MTTIGNRQVARIFEEAAESYDACSNAYTMRRRAEALASFVLGRCFEVGGGTAAVTAILPDRSRAYHSDIAFRMCRVARAKVGRPSVCFDAERIPLAAESVDTIVSAEMIYYLRRPERFVAEAFRVLTPGGRLVLSTTNPLMTVLDRGRGILRRLGFTGMFFDDGSPRFLALSRIRRLLRSAGFQVELVRGIVPIPIAKFDRLNRLVESTILHRLGLFLIVVARKN